MTDFPMEADDLAKAIEIPLEQWPGNCHAIALAVLRRVPVAGMRLVRGHYLGHIHRNSVFRGGPQQHSWLELEDGRILDPTRWALTSPDRPSIYLGVNDSYDEAGLMLRAQMSPGIYMASFMSQSERNTPEHAVLKALSKASHEDLEELYAAAGIAAPDGPPCTLCAESIYERMHDPVEHFKDPETFFGTLRKIGLGALPPHDTMVRVLEPERVTVDRGANHLYEVPPAPEMTEQQKLFQVFCRFLSIEHRDLQIEDELEEYGYTLDELHSALNEMERFLKHEPDGSFIPRDTRSLLAVVGADLLGKGFGAEIEVERFARSIGLNREGLHHALETFGSHAGYDMAWLMPDEIAQQADELPEPI